MKRTLIAISFLLIISSCKNKKPGDNFIGNWTDGTWRHIAIRAAKDGYVVEDISKGDKKYTAKYFDDELIVNVDKGGVSIFNYMKGTDEIFAEKITFHREAGSK